MEKSTDTLANIIIALERAALEQWNNGNPSAYLELYADEITYFDPFFEKRLNGYKQMEEYYERIRGTVFADSYDMINPVVQSSGDIAVLTFNLNSYAGANIYKWNCTEIYKLDNNKQWKIIHTHWSLVMPLENKNE